MSKLSLAAHLLPIWRQKRGLAQGSAAKLFGVTQPSLSEYESGKKIPRTKLALRIQRVTDGEVPIGAWDEDAPEAAPESGEVGEEPEPAKGAA
jgi:transcriptional regulator with XRE-family HTH domain